MQIGILGSGVVGRTLGGGFAAAGHDVMLGSREPESQPMRDWRDQVGQRTSTGTFAQVAAFGELLVLSTLWAGTENAIRLADPANARGKVVIDTTNPLHYAPNAPPSLAVGYTDSAGERVQRWLPEARVVKAFNTVGNSHMVHPRVPGGPPELFVCGNDEAAKRSVADLVREIGWPAITDLGGIEASRYLEPLAMVWILYGVRNGTWSHAFKLLRS